MKMLMRRICYWLGRSKRRDLEEEIELHIAEKAQELQAQGWTNLPRGRRRGEGSATRSVRRKMREASGQ